VRSGGTLQFTGEVTRDLTAGPQASATVFAGATISSGGNLDLEGATVLSGVTLTLAAQTGNTANSNGTLTVNSGGVLLGPGDLGSADPPHPGGFADVFGAATGVTAQAMTLQSGRTASDVTVALGLIQIGAGGYGVGTVLAAGAGEFVSSGGVAVGTVFSGADGYEYVLSSGTATGTVITDGDLQLVSAGGVASATLVSQGREYVEGLVISARLSGPLSNEEVFAGGLASDTTLLAGGILDIDSGGLASATLVSSGGVVIRLGGAARQTTLLSGGDELV
jgi:autotransporter passenger strand-loop-strand repeat protein